VNAARQIEGNSPEDQELRATEQRKLMIDLPLTLLMAAATPPASGATQDPLRLPLTISENNPVTSIEVAGHEINIVVDTGGGVLGLSPEALAQAGAVELTGEPTIWTDAQGRAHKARRFRVPQIRVGGRFFTDLDAIEAETIPNGPPVPNVLGREFLRHFVVIFDYPGRMLTLLSPETTDAEAEAMGCKGTRVPFEPTPTEPGLAISRVTVDGAMLRLAWDTGAQYSALPADVVTEYELPVDPAVGEKPPFYNTKRLIIGRSDFGPLDFVVLPLKLPSDGVLGYNAFAKHVVCLNYGRSELRIR
jgi:gag-polyprotein putative aspartyl protease/Aspartyl protease